MGSPGGNTVHPPSLKPASGSAPPLHLSEISTLRPARILGIVGTATTRVSSRGVVFPTWRCVFRALSRSLVFSRHFVPAPHAQAVSGPRNTSNAPLTYSHVVPARSHASDSPGSRAPDQAHQPSHH